MNIIIILFYAFINTSNFYRSIFGYSNNNTNVLNISLLFSYLKNLLYSPQSKYIKADSELDEDNNCFIYLNGIMAYEEMVQLTKLKLEKMTKKPINILFNRSQSLIFDLYESLIGKTSDKLTEASKLTLHIISNKLIDDKINKVIIIAYSQGTIIISKVLRYLNKVGLDDEKYLKKLEIYCFANCSSQTTYLKNELPFLEHFANKEDFVAKLGCNCSDKVKKYINIDGPIYINENGWGHMLENHYLNDFKHNFPHSQFNKYLIM